MDEFPTLDLDFTPEPEVAHVEVAEPEVNDEVEVAETSPEDSPEPDVTEEEPTDGRKVPDEIRKALKAFRDLSPENAKAARALNDVYGREQAYRQHFATVKDAETAIDKLQTIESFGGLEAVQSTIAEIEEIDQLLQAGDGKAVEKIFEVSGDGFGKIAPAMLDKLQASNPDAYAAAIRPHLVSAIGASGLTEAFGAVMQAMSISQTPGATPEFKAKFEKDASDGLAKIHQYLQGLGKQPAPSATAATGSSDKLSERENAISAREAQVFNGEVGRLANSKINQSLAKAINPYIKGLNSAQRADFATSVYNEVAKLAKADKNYQTGKDNLFKSKTRDATKIAQHMSAKFEAVVGQAAKTVRELRGGAPATAVPAAPVVPGGNGSVDKPLPVKQLPNRQDIDWNKTTDDMTMRGVRVLKSGKVVRLVG